MNQVRTPRPQSRAQLKLLLLLTQVMVSDSDSHRWANFAYRLLGGVAVMAMWLWLLTPLELIYSGVPLALSWGVLVIWSIRRLIVRIARESVVNEAMLMGAIAGYLHLGLTAGLIMGAVETIQPGSFMPLELPTASLNAGGSSVLSVGDSFAEISYFAFVCLTTVGFGDINPMLPLSRMISLLTSIIGPLYLAVVMGILIGRFVSTNQPDQAREDA